MSRLFRMVLFVTIFLLLSCGLWWQCVPLHEWIFSRKSLLSASADKLKSTIITPHLEQPMAPGKNVLWCSTFQLAWNEICTLIGEDIHMEDEPSMVAILNTKAATRKDLDDASFVALAGWIRDGLKHTRHSFRAGGARPLLP